MKILMLSTDGAIFDHDAPVRARLLEQAALVTELHVVVFTPRGEKFQKFHAGKHLTVYPTSSAGKWAYLPDAFRIARAIILHEHHPKSWLITAQDPFEVGALGYVLSALLHVPLHLQIHTDPWSEEWKNERKLNRMRFAIMRYLLHRAAGIRVVSERVKREVLSEGVPTERVTQVPIYTDVSTWKKAVPTFDLHRSYTMFDKIILSIGRLQPEKNFHGLIRAFAQVRKQHADTMLLIVGSGPERERLLALASSLGLHEAVVILPWARDVVSYYKTCDFYVQPSRYEGWGLAVVEAMASGTPVLMTNVGVAGELVRDHETGIVIPPESDDALVAGLNELLGNATLRKTLATAGAREVEKLPSHTETMHAYKESWMKAMAHHEHKRTKKA